MSWLRCLADSKLRFPRLFLHHDIIAYVVISSGNENFANIDKYVGWIVDYIMIVQSSSALLENWSNLDNALGIAT